MNRIALAVDAHLRAYDRNACFIRAKNNPADCTDARERSSVDRQILRNRLSTALQFVRRECDVPFRILGRECERPDRKIRDSVLTGIVGHRPAHLVEHRASDDHARARNDCPVVIPNIALGVATTEEAQVDLSDLPEKADRTLEPRLLVRPVDRRDPAQFVRAAIPVGIISRHVFEEVTSGGIGLVDLHGLEPSVLRVPQRDLRLWKRLARCAEHEATQNAGRAMILDDRSDLVEGNVRS